MTGEFSWLNNDTFVETYCTFLDFEMCFVRSNVYTNTLMIYIKIKTMVSYRKDEPRGLKLYPSYREVHYASKVA